MGGRRNAPSLFLLQGVLLVAAALLLILGEEVFVLKGFFLQDVIALTSELMIKLEGDRENHAAPLIPWQPTDHLYPV